MGKHYSTFSLLDYSAETSSATVHHGAITPTSLAGFLTDFGALKTAIDNVTAGTLAKEQWVGDATELSNVPPTDITAQRELKWLISYEGDTSKKRYTTTLPTARLVAGVLRPRSDEADLTFPAMAALVTAFETIGRTPDDDTETVTVLSIRLVGRNL